MNYVSKVVDRLNEEIPGNDPELINLYSLLVMTRGAYTTLEDVHDAWSVWRNNTKPDHKSLIPFDHLTEEVQELDRVYVHAIRKVALER